MARLVAMLLNPKNGRAVEVRALSDRKPCIYLVGADDDEEAIGCSSLVQSHPVTIDRDEYVRIHTPGGVGQRGEGYGLMLYAGSALAARATRGRAGVFSIPGDRSEAAETIWSKMVEKGLASEGFTYLEDEREDEQEHCFPISDRNRELDDGGWVASDTVCGQVTVVYSSTETEVTYINADTVLSEPFVIAYFGDEEEEDHERPPVDFLVRARVDTAEGAKRLYQILRDNYSEEAAAAFMSRPDIAELFGQQRLLGGYRRALGQLGVTRPVPLPPISRETRQLIAKYRDVP